MILSLIACLGGADHSTDALAARVWVESQDVKSGESVRLHAPSDATVLPVQGLTIKPEGDGIWTLSGEDASYVLQVNVDGETEPARVFVDIGVDGPSGGPMDDLAGLPPKPAAIWPWVLGAIVALAALVVGAWLAWNRFKPVPPPPPPIAADIIARREWSALRARSDLAHENLALELSGVYRRYLEAVHHWPATQRTTREILNAIAGEYTAANLERSKRLLMAMDLVKFADREARESLFDDLDRDFDALVVRRA